MLGRRGITWDAELLDEALLRGEDDLGAVSNVHLVGELAEHPLFVRYHEIVLDALGVVGDRAELAEAIATEMESSLPVEPYSWTRPVLEELQQRRLPAEEGISKPDPRVYEIARALLGRAQQPFTSWMIGRRTCRRPPT